MRPQFSFANKSMEDFCRPVRCPLTRRVCEERCAGAHACTPWKLASAKDNPQRKDAHTSCSDGVGVRLEHGVVHAHVGLAHVHAALWPHHAIPQDVRSLHVADCPAAGRRERNEEARGERGRGSAEQTLVAAMACGIEKRQACHHACHDPGENARFAETNENYPRKFC